LFDRTTRHVEPTAHGRQFATVARRFTEDLERGMDDLRAHVDRQQGLVVVGAAATMITSVLIPALKGMALRYPGIRVRIIEVLTAEAVERVRAGDMDMAFTTIALPDADFDTTPVMRDAFHLVCPPSHPLSGHEGPLSWDVFNDHAAVGMSGESGIRGILKEHAAGQLAVSGLVYEVSSVWGLIRMVRDGLGIAAVPGLVAQAMASEDIPGFRLTPPIHRTVSLITRAGRSPTPAAGTLVSAALAQLRNVQSDGIEIPVTEEQLAERGFSAG
jgi:DNA-binding transcriptional LysR family regulator